MIQLTRKQLFPEQMEVLYQTPFTPESVAEDFIAKSGTWTVEDGWLKGYTRENGPGMILSKQDFFGDILMEFDASTTLPSTHDVNVTWHAEWEEAKNSLGTAYVAGLAGWWDQKIGFEISPAYTFAVFTQAIPFVPGKVYHVTVGDLNGHFFLDLDGTLVLEGTDPAPMDHNRYGKIGFGAFCSSVKFKNLKVKRITYQEDPKNYSPEF